MGTTERTAQIARRSPTSLGVLGWGLTTANPWLILLALIAPVIAALFWGRHYPAGLIAGYALPIVALPAITCLLSY